jgi:type VII secretion effector (TIGR04197 family)
MTTLNVNQETVNEQADALSAAVHFETKTLTNIDNESTITANTGGKNAFQSSQATASGLGNALDKEAENIRSLGVSFEEFDQMMSTINQGQ